MHLEQLKVLGLTEGQVKVYSAILNTGISSINSVHEKTGLERRAIYDILNKLIEKGLVSYTIEKGKRAYQCSPPGKIKAEIRRKQEELDGLQKQLPEIERIYTTSKPKVSIEVFRGKEGIKAVFEDMLNYKENYFIGGGYYIMDLLPNYWPQYNKRRINLGVKWYNLGRHETKSRKIPEKKLFWARYLPKEFSGSPSVVFIFGDKIVNVLWGEEWFAFMVHSQEIAENYKKYHKYLWHNVAKP